MKDIQQLIKKSNEVGRYDNVFPKTFIDAIKDRETGVSLRDILSSFNMYFLTYMGSPEDTRLQLPKSLRRMGVWITYVTWDNTVHIEWYSSDDISDETFKSSLYWKEGTNSLVGDLSISAEGNWIINGEDTDIPARGEKGITPVLKLGKNNKFQVSYNEGGSYSDITSEPIITQLRVNDNKLQKSLDLGKTWEDESDYISSYFREKDNKIQISKDKETWEDISDNIAAWFRFKTEEGQSQNNSVGKIQISRDERNSWQDLSADFTNRLHIKGYVKTKEDLPKAVQGDMYGVGPIFEEEDTEKINPIYTLYVFSDGSWVDNGRYTSIDAGVVQELGDSETEVMSQKAVTGLINEGYLYAGIAVPNTEPPTIKGKVFYLASQPGNYVNFGEDIKVNKGNVVILRNNPQNGTWTATKTTISSLYETSKVFNIPSDYQYNIENFLPIKDIKLIGDVFEYSEFSIYDTKPYSKLATEDDIAISFLGAGQTWRVTKKDIDPKLGVQRIIKEGIRDNVYLCVTIDFTELETNYGIVRGYVYPSSFVTYINPFYERRKHLIAGVCKPDSQDTYKIGDVIYMFVSPGTNTLTNFKTRTSSTNYNAVHSPIVIDSNGASYFKLLKVDVDDWVILEKIMNEYDGIVYSKMNDIVGFLSKSSSLRSENKLGLNTSEFTVAIKFSTADTINNNEHLFDNGTLKIWTFSSRKSVMVTTGSSNVVESQPLKENTNYVLYVYLHNGKLSLEVDGYVKEGNLQELVGTEHNYVNIGGEYIYNEPRYKFSGIIQFVRVYNKYVSKSVILSKALTDRNQCIMNLTPQALTEYAWLDSSDSGNCCMPVFSKVISVIYGKLSTSDNIPVTTEIEKKNLFSEDNVLRNKILDSTYGKIADWNPEKKGEYGAVAVIPAKKGKYYCIFNPYNQGGMYRVGVMNDGRDYGNGSTGNIILSGRMFTIAKAEYGSNQSGVPVDSITFNLYRVQNTVPNVTDTPLVEVYEMDSESEAVKFIYNKYGQNSRLSSDINIDLNILESNRVGTISQIYKDKSIMIFGDSISANHGWSNYIMNKFKIRNLYNVAIGGANIAGSKDATESGGNRNLIFQIENSPKSMADVCYIEGENINGEYIKKIDCIIISMGFNDANNGRTVGSLDDVKSVEWSTLRPELDTQGFSSVMAAIKYCVFLMKTTIQKATVNINDSDVVVGVDYTKAKIIFQTPIQSSAGDDGLVNRLAGLEKGIEEICEYYSIPVINGYKLCGIVREEEKLYESGKYLKDGIHPNADGYIKMGEMNAGGLLSHFI